MAVQSIRIEKVIVAAGGAREGKGGGDGGGSRAAIGIAKKSALEYSQSSAGGREVTFMQIKRIARDNDFHFATICRALK